MALADLIRPRSREQVVQRMLTVLSSSVDAMNFAPTNYVPGDPLRTLLELAGEGISDVERLVAGLAEAGYLQTAKGEWLSLLTESHYGISRQPSTFATGSVRFGASTAGAVQLPAGTIVGTASGLKYMTLEAAIVPAGGTADVPVQAEQPGALYNVPAGLITAIHTPPPGVVVTNLANWLTSAGANEETDSALRTRASLRWAELGGGATRSAYLYWAYSAHPAVDRVNVLDEHPRGQGTVDVILWGSGGLGADVVAEVNAYIQARRPVTADVKVYAATPRTVAVPLNLYAIGNQDALEAQITANLAQLQQAAGIGERFYASAVVEAAMLPTGVMDARTTMPDQVLEPNEAIILAPVLTWRSTP